MNPRLAAHLDALNALSTASHHAISAGWMAQHLIHGTTFAHQSHRRFLAASTIKLPLLMCYAQHRDQPQFQSPYHWQASDHVEDSPFFEKGQPGQTLSWDTLAEWMMILSDNAATNLLIQALGLPTLQTYLHSLPVELPHTVLARLMMDAEARAAGRENWTSPQDMATLMAALVQGQCLDATATRWVLDILFRCEDPEKIPFLFRPPLEVANKPGELPGLRADVAYIHNGHFASGKPPSQAVVMAIFCDGVAPEAETACDLWQAELAQILWQLLCP